MRWEAHDKANRRPDRVAQTVFCLGSEGGQERKSSETGNRRARCPSSAEPGPYCLGGGCVRESGGDSAALARGPGHAGPKVGPGVPGFLDRCESTATSPRHLFRARPRLAGGWRWRGGLHSRAHGRRLFWLACWQTESGNTISEPGWRPPRIISVTRVLRRLIPTCSNSWLLSWCAQAGVPRPCIA